MGSARTGAASARAGRLAFVFFVFVFFVFVAGRPATFRLRAAVLTAFFPLGFFFFGAAALRLLLRALLIAMVRE